EGRLRVCRYDLARVEERCCLTQARQFCEERTNLVFGAEQQIAKLGMPLERDLGASQHDAWSSVTPHRIERDRDAVAHGARPPARRLSVRASLAASWSPRARRNSHKLDTGDAAA